MTINPLMLVDFLLGAALLLFGRRLFWLLVAGAGFLVGAHLADVWLVEQPQWVVVMAAVVAGVLGALLAIFFQRAAFGIAGLLAGAAVALQTAAALGMTDSQWIPAAIGGALGLLAALLLTDWALIVLSALIGAAALAASLTAAFDLQPTIRPLVMLVLAFVGILFQSRQLRGRAR